MTIVELAGVTKTYASGESTLTVLDRVDLTIERGSTTEITGASGSGKSTLLNQVGGLDRVSGGRLVSAGYELHRLAEQHLTEYRARELGFVFQFHYLLKDFTAVENVMLPAYMTGVDRAEALGRARVLLAEVGLADRLHHFPSQLSGGERQRVALARALVNRPSLLLADEPTGNLDEENSRIVEQLLVDLVRSHGTTLVVVTHDPRIARLGDNRYVLAGGALTPAGSLDGPAGP